jgi:ABC-type lipoprotein release transport system permease subunit
MRGPDAPQIVYWRAMITVPLILTISTALANHLPARRAAAVDPVESLSAE